MTLHEKLCGVRYGRWGEFRVNAAITSHQGKDRRAEQKDVRRLKTAGKEQGKYNEGEIMGRGRPCQAAIGQRGKG